MSNLTVAFVILEGSPTKNYYWILMNYLAVRYPDVEFAPIVGTLEQSQIVICEDDRSLLDECDIVLVLRLKLDSDAVKGQPDAFLDISKLKNIHPHVVNLFVETTCDLDRKLVDHERGFGGGIFLGTEKELKISLLLYLSFDGKRVTVHPEDRVEQNRVSLFLLKSCFNYVLNGTI